ncbi:MAG: hypothetical protein DRN66_03310 [Candidatus Nanohalarchaeota archaeon]|nr:MAG: hypothetical protein DRN66_03310 [Candidatus Nanohaloarchaeota archaeon]
MSINKKLTVNVAVFLISLTILSAFSYGAKTNLIILNPQSYPMVGGNWTVIFNTAETENLIISALNGTSWSDSNEENDLKFLEIKCGNHTLDYTWLNETNSVFIQNYACNETGYETSKVLTTGRHNLKFQFGDIIRYAHNWADNGSAAQTVDACGTLSTANAIYTLNQSVNSSGTCFTITANNITLDCAGHTINYSQSSQGYAVYDDGYDYATVKNCIIVRENTSIVNSHGIYYEHGANNATFYNNTINHAYSGIYLYNSNNTNITSNIIKNSNDTGIFFRDINDSVVKDNIIENTATNGIDLWSLSTGNQIINNTIRNMTGINGIRIRIAGSDNNSIINNTIENVDDYGIYAISSENTIITGNTITDITNWYGIYLSSGSNNSNIEDNNINNTYREAIYVDASENVTIKDNTIYNVTWLYGIHLDSGGDNSKIDSNTITNVAWHGIYIEPSENTDIINNTITDITNWYGIYLSSGSNNSNIEDNNINNTYREAIYVDASENVTIKDNTIYNVTWRDGISLAAGTHNLTIKDNSIDNTRYGIYTSNSTNLNITGNTIKNSRNIGIYLNPSNNSIIADNIIYDSADYGIYIISSSNCKIYNNLFNNTNNYFIGGTIYTNNWNTTNQTGARVYGPGSYIGGNYWTNSTGNGYSDTCADSNRDGFCDDAYNLSAGSSVAYDYLPLSDEYSNISFFIHLNSPPNQAYTSDNTPDFNFTVSGSESLYSCEVFINDTGYGDTKVFTNVGHINDGGTGVGVWGDGTYIYLANWNDGLRAYTFNGTDFTNVGHINNGGTGIDVWGDGTYIYLANYDDGLRAYTFNGSNFTNVGHINNGGAGWGVWGNGTYIYLANYDDGLRAYTFNGSNFTNVGHINNGGYEEDVWGDGTYVYLANSDDGLRAYTFNGTAFTNVGHINNGGSGVGIWGDGTYIYLANWNDGLRAYTFNGTAFTNVGHINNGGAGWGVWGDGTYIYLANDDDGLRAYAFDGSTFTNVGHIDNGGEGWGVWGDGTYIYLANWNDELRAYAFGTLNNMPTTITANSSLSDGIYNWYINCTAGGVINQSEIREITIDTIPPQITILSPLVQQYADSSIWFNATLNEEADWCGYSLDSAANWTMQNTTGNWNDLNSSMAEGQHNVVFYCNDTAGNMNSTSAIYFDIIYMNAKLYVSLMLPNTHYVCSSASGILSSGTAEFTYTNPPDAYIASFGSSTVYSLSSSSAEEISAQNYSSSHKISISTTDDIYLGFTKGDCSTVSKKYSKIKQETLLQELSPAFSYIDEDSKVCVMAGATYDRINLTGSLDLGNGNYELFIEKYGLDSSGNPVVNIRRN